MADKGRFVWYELMTRDPNRALDFYGNVLGWGNIPWNAGEHPYTIFTRNPEDKTSVGGMMEMTEPQFPTTIPSHIMGYISTDDVDAAAERIKELGGQIYHGPADIPEVGRFAVAQDPQGGVFSLLQPQSAEEGGELHPQIGDFSWNELMTTDYEAAFNFYQELFGWQIAQDMDMGGGMMYRLFTPNGMQVPIGGIFTKPADIPGPPGWCYYVNVADIDTAIETVKEKGGQILNGPEDVPGGKIAQCMDPEGTFFALHMLVEVPVTE